jgi:predicted nucleotidyltransferase
MSLNEIAQKHRLCLMVLFGSRAISSQTDHSDFDVGVEFEKSTIAPDILGLIADLEQYFRGPVDLSVISMTTNALLLHEIASGRLLFENTPGAFVNFQCRAWKEYIDARLVRERQFRWLKEFV